MPGNVKDKKERREVEKEERNGDEAEYLVDDLEDRIDGSSGSRLQLFRSQFGLGLFKRRSSIGGYPHGFVIRPDNRLRRLRKAGDPGP